MIQTTDADLTELQPYTESQYQAALERVLASPMLPTLFHTYFPEARLDEFVAMARSLRTISEFQIRVIAPTIKAMLAQGSGGMTVSGLETLKRDRQYLFISNHRDIILDPALLTAHLAAEGYRTPRICLGDNLLTSPLITDLIKMNKGVTVKRGLAPRELLRWSQALSELIYRSIHGREDSVWIAQKQGRTKNGDDQTHPGILKMLTMAGEGSLLDRISALHIVPVAISYEYDPCDVFKAHELHVTATEGRYVKAPGEDTRSMVKGILGQKGRIHIGIGREIVSEVRDAHHLELKKDLLQRLAEGVDEQIHQLHRLWPSHFIAFDVLDSKETFKERYGDAQKKAFLERVEARLDRLATTPEVRLSNEDRAGIRRQLLEAYAKPVTNHYQKKSPARDLTQDLKQSSDRAFSFLKD